MKNEALVNAITGIDDDLIGDAHASGRGKVLPFRKILAAAACIALAVTAAIGFMSRSKVSITAFEKDIGNQPVVVAESGGVSDVRSNGESESARIAVPMEIEVNRKTDISVSDGSIQVLDLKTGALLYNGDCYTCESDVSVVWLVRASKPGSCFEMHLVSGKSKQIVTLNYSDNKWTMQKTN